MAERKDTKFMTKALELAGRAGGSTLPNPMVGAVLVKNGRIVSQGTHHGPGTPHAEVVAIKKAGKNSRGATLFVNLEPCCHTGRTGPCTESIIEAGIKKVVYAAIDPNPTVNGKGAKRLRQAGLEVANGMLTREAVRFNDAYIGSVVNARPFVTIKLAQSLDGRIATATGDSKWISSKESRQYVHELRSKSQAVMVGMGTVEKDNPELTTRLVKGKNPYRIVVTDKIELNNKLNLIKKNNDQKTIIAATEKNVNSISKKAHSRSLTYWSLKKDKKNRVDLKDLMTKAWDFGIRSILVEGGADIVTSLLKDKLVDKIILITAPIIVGSGVDSINDLAVKNVKSAIKFSDYYKFESGSDTVFVGYPDWSRK